MKDLQYYNDLLHRCVTYHGVSVDLRSWHFGLGCDYKGRDALLLWNHHGDMQTTFTLDDTVESEILKYKLKICDWIARGQKR